MNIHTPERQPHESFKSYKERRARSLALARDIERGMHIFVPENKLENKLRNRRRRDIKMLGGIRQYKKYQKAARAAAKQ